MDHLSRVILLEWNFIAACASGEKSEVPASLNSLKHLINLRYWPKTLELDCVQAKSSLTKKRIRTYHLVGAYGMKII
jgi:hypothetical protein